MADYREFDASQELSFNAKNIAEFRATGGKVSGAFEGFDLLLLTSIGAKSGQERTSPVGRFDINGKVYIVGSAAGRDANPAWVANIRKTPAVKVEIGANPPANAVATELDPAERDRIFEIVKQRAPGFAGYEAATDRVIPVFEITPA